MYASLISSSTAPTIVSGGGNEEVASAHAFTSTTAMAMSAYACASFPSPKGGGGGEAASAAATAVCGGKGVDEPAPLEPSTIKALLCGEASLEEAIRADWAIKQEKKKETQCTNDGVHGDANPSLSDASPEELQAFYYGARLRPLFGHKQGNRSINFGSFGISPCFISARKAYHVMFQEGDTDAWVRIHGPPAYGRVRSLMADYINTDVIGDGFDRGECDEKHRAQGVEGKDTVSPFSSSASSVIGNVHPDEVFFVDNLADAANVVARSFLANWRFPLNRQPNTQQKLPINSDGRERVIVYFSNQYPMVKAAVKFYSDFSLAAVGGSVFVDSDEGGGGAHGSDATSSSSSPSIRVVEFKMTTAMMLDSVLFANSVASFVKTNKADGLVMDHYCWAPTFVMPIVAICTAVRRVQPRCFIVVDGAHSIGQHSIAHVFRRVDVEVEEVSLHQSSPPKGDNADLAPLTKRTATTISVPLVDAYMANCHKWLTTPRSIAVLVVPREHQAFLHPNIISNQYRGFGEEESGAVRGDASSLCASVTPAYLQPSPDLPLDASHSTRVQAEFYWCGTRDMSPWMVLPDVLWYRSRCLGGEGSIMRHNQWLANKGARAIGAVWGTETLFDLLERFQLEEEAANAQCAAASSSSSRFDRQLGSLVCVRAPTDDASVNIAVCRHVLEHCDTFAAPVTFRVPLTPHSTSTTLLQFIRVSAQVYNSLSDYTYFATAYLEVLLAKGRSENSPPNV